VSVVLNGVKLPGHGLHVAANLQLASEDLSGNSSSTASAEKGDKPKTLTVRFSIKFKDAADLRRVVALAEARDGKTQRTVFTIVNDTAQAMGIRQVRFDGEFGVMEQYNLRQWDVNFNLAEFRSVPEKKQERAAAKAVSAQKAAGAAAGGAGGSGSGAAGDGSMTWFESHVLKPFNDILK